MVFFLNKISCRVFQKFIIVQQQPMMLFFLYRQGFVKSLLGIIFSFVGLFFIEIVCLIFHIHSCFYRVDLFGSERRAPKGNDLVCHVGITIQGTVLGVGG